MNFVNAYLSLAGVFEVKQIAPPPGEFHCFDGGGKYLGLKTVTVSGYVEEGGIHGVALADITAENFPIDATFPCDQPGISWEFEMSQGIYPPGYAEVGTNTSPLLKMVGANAPVQPAVARAMWKSIGNAGAANTVFAQLARVQILAVLDHFAKKYNQ